jgi:ATP-dependent phosphoenolpyruvate carboxykinase
LTSTEQIASHYRDQATYISSRIIDLVPKIIANSATPPIIVIQGDHGPTIPSSSRTRMKNLNVYFLSGGNASLYSTITPVNTFRVIFNTYFGQNLPLLDDVSLYSKYRFPFDYKIIPNTCNAND